ncbi:hypothetical protein BN1708_008130, partial [Verticillium longisporum]
ARSVERYYYGRGRPIGPQQYFAETRRTKQTGPIATYPGLRQGWTPDKDTELSDSAPTRQYYTQACLLGLKRGRKLDNNCPNVLSYRTTKGST